MMLRISVTAILASFLLISCGEDKSTTLPSYDELYGEIDTTQELPSFFPVSDFIESKLKEVEAVHPTVKFYKKENGMTDSTIMESKKMSLFLDELRIPSIDSTKMSVFFTEKKFKDETLGWVTLSYDPNSSIPDSIPWKRWDVHIDPETGEVKRIFLIKEVSSTRSAQLTWLPASGCKIIIIDHTSTEKPMVKSEMSFNWVF